MRKKLISLLLALSLFDLTATHETHAESEKFNMTYLSYGSASALVRSIDMTKGSLQVVSPGYFLLNADGSLNLTEGVNAEFVSAMHHRNIKVVPFLGNDWNRDLGRKALQNRELLSEQIAQTVIKYDLDGINVDIENVTKEDRENYTDFVRKLRAKLPAGKEVSVAIAADPGGMNPLYDHKAMSSYVDYFMLMSYDEHYPGDPNPGPVASLPFVEKSIRQALQEISADKLVLGIPFYGRFWNGDPAFDGQGISIVTAEKLMSELHGTQTYDETAQSVKGAFTVPIKNSSVKFNGKPLPPGSYTLWYENDRSLKAKLELVQKYGLKGTGSWSLEQSTADTWDYYSLWLNGLRFADMEGHWAQSDVLRAALKQWMTGVGDTQFAPDQPLTRAQAAAVLNRVYGSEATASLLPAVSFADVPLTHWAFKDITLAAQKGYIQGMADALFAPDEPLTREQFCQMMARILSLPQTVPSSVPVFSDVSAGNWSYSAIAAMRDKNLIDGFEDNTFRPQQPFTRAQMAVILNRINPQLVK